MPFFWKLPNSIPSTSLIHHYSISIFKHFVLIPNLKKITDFVQKAQSTIHNAQRFVLYYSVVLNIPKILCAESFYHSPALVFSDRVRDIPL